MGESTKGACDKCGADVPVPSKIQKDGWQIPFRGTPRFEHNDWGHYFMGFKLMAVRCRDCAAKVRHTAS